MIQEIDKSQLDDISTAAWSLEYLVPFPRSFPHPCPPLNPRCVGSQVQRVSNEGKSAILYWRLAILEQKKCHDPLGRDEATVFVYRDGVECKSAQRLILHNINVFSRCRKCEYIMIACNFYHKYDARAILLWLENIRPSISLIRMSRNWNSQIFSYTCFWWFSFGAIHVSSEFRWNHINEKWYWGLSWTRNAHLQWRSLGNEGRFRASTKYYLSINLNESRWNYHQEGPKEPRSYRHTIMYVCIRWWANRCIPFGRPLSMALYKHSPSWIILNRLEIGSIESV